MHDFKKDVDTSIHGVKMEHERSSTLKPDELRSTMQYPSRHIARVGLHVDLGQCFYSTLTRCDSAGSARLGSSLSAVPTTNDGQGGNQVGDRLFEGAIGRQRSCRRSEWCLLIINCRSRADDFATACCTQRIRSPRDHRDGQAHPTHCPDACVHYHDGGLEDYVWDCDGEGRVCASTQRSQLKSRSRTDFRRRVSHISSASSTEPFLMSSGYEWRRMLLRGLR